MNMPPTCGTCKHWKYEWGKRGRKECDCPLPLWIIACLERDAIEPSDWVMDKDEDATNCDRYEPEK
jgi:hypothetical protein